MHTQREVQRSTSLIRPTRTEISLSLLYSTRGNLVEEWVDVMKNNNSHRIGFGLGGGQNREGVEDRLLVQTEEIRYRIDYIEMYCLQWTTA